MATNVVRKFDKRLVAVPDVDQRPMLGTLEEVRLTNQA